MSIYRTSLEIIKPPFLGGNNWVLKNLTDITVIFGRNASGKSTLLRNILNQDKKNRHYISPERSGQISFDPHMMLDEMDPETRENQRNKNMVIDFRQRVISMLQVYLTKRGAAKDQKVYFNFMPDKIERLVSELMPQFKLEITGERTIYKLIRQESEKDISGITQLSSGECEIFTIALDIVLMCAIWQLDSQEERILLLDEPDLHIHPELQQILSNFIVNVMNEFSAQIIIATHSTTLLSSLGFHGGTKTSAIYLNNETKEQNAIKFKKTYQELATCLGGHVLMGPLFGHPLLLVEGDDDFIIWSHACRHGHLKFAVIPCNGDEINKYAKTLKTILSSIVKPPEKPLAFKLRDKDEKKIPKNIYNNAYIKSLFLNCREIENLYITNEILDDIGTSWNEAKIEIKKKSVEYGDKKEDLKQMINRNRRKVDLKGIIKQIVMILDPKSVDWKVRLANYLGKNTPDGQIKDFLGPDVISAFWQSEGNSDKTQANLPETE